MYKKAVIENMFEDKAVLLIGEEEEEKTISNKLLPKEARVGDWINLTIKDDEIVEVVADKEETKKVRSRIEKKLEILRNRLKK